MPDMIVGHLTDSPVPSAGWNIFYFILMLIKSLNTVWSASFIREYKRACFYSRDFPERGIKLQACAGGETDSSTSAPLPASHCQHVGCMFTTHTLWERHTLPHKHLHHHIVNYTPSTQHPPTSNYLFYIWDCFFLPEPVQLPVVVVQRRSRAALPRAAVLLCCSQLWTGEHSNTTLTANLEHLEDTCEELL